MKVLHVLPNLQIGGIQRFVLDIVSYQKEVPDVSVAIFICTHEKAQWENAFNHLEVPIYWGNIKPKRINFVQYRYFKKIQKQYDIVHWHVFVPGLCCFSFFNKKKYIFTHHSVLGEGRVRHRTDRIKWILFRWFINHRVDCEVYNSLYTKSFWQSYGLHARSNCLIYNGAKFVEPPFDQSEVTEREKFTLEDKFIIGTTCNLIRWKRVDILIKAFSIWCKDKINVCLLIVGEGGERKNLEQLAKDLKIEEKVLFVGHKKQVSYYQKIMDVCVFPSITETFGLAALECLHKGKPTICLNDGGGICEVIGDKRNIVDSIDNMVRRFDELYQEKETTGTCDSITYIKQSNLFRMGDKALEYIDLYKRIYLLE